MVDSDLLARAKAKIAKMTKETKKLYDDAAKCLFLNNFAENIKRWTVHLGELEVQGLCFCQPLEATANASMTTTKDRRSTSDVDTHTSTPKESPECKVSTNDASNTTFMLLLLQVTQLQL